MNKYEGFEVSKKTEKEALKIEKELTLTEILPYIKELEFTGNKKSLGNYMVNHIGFDWNRNPVNVAIYNIINSIMIQDDEGYWIEK